MQEKSTRYELPAINFHLGETPTREPAGRGGACGSRKASDYSAPTETSAGSSGIDSTACSPSAA